jgi:hypothetical protein
MPITAQYQTYYGIHLNHWTETWASTNYNKILVKDAPDVECESTPTTSCSSSASFILPELIKGKYYLDGIASGHFHLSSTVTSTVTSIIVTIELINNGGTIRDVGTYSATLGYSLVTNDTVAIPFYINLSKVEVTENEKIALVFSVTTGANVFFYHDIVPTEGDMDVELVLPYAPIR